MNASSLSRLLIDFNDHIVNHAYRRIEKTVFVILDIHRLRADISIFGEGKNGKGKERTY